MAESQLACLEDGRVGERVPDSRPEFYYSEEQRAALEALLREGDGAFKSRLEEDKTADFLSAREIKVVRNTLQKFRTSEEEPAPDSQPSQAAEKSQQPRPAGSASLRSTYWPQMSDTEVPALDIGWPHTGFFKGVTRVAVHTHPPKDNGPHVKEVVRRLIQEASKVIAIVMDLLTDLHILQDLLDAASKRRVPVYIILDNQGVPHFLDMCNRLQVTSQHLQNIRIRTVKAVGFDLSFGRIPGSMCSKYMLIDGDKVMFGTYSFSWISARMDRNMITVMSGQIVDFFDRDFRELYAISDKLDLFKEFSISKTNTGTLGRVTVPKRPSVPATSRFQVSLGDKGTLKVPEHKYYNPKYLLAFGDIPAPSSSLNQPEPEVPPEDLTSDKTPAQEGSEKLEGLTPLPSPSEKGTLKKLTFFKKKSRTSKSKSKSKSKVKDELTGTLDQEGPPSVSSTSNPAQPNGVEDLTAIPEEPALENKPPAKAKNKKLLKKRSSSQQTINSQVEQGSKDLKQSPNKCVLS